jgi:hypothetical protein
MDSTVQTGRLRGLAAITDNNKALLRFCDRRKEGALTVLVADHLSHIFRLLLCQLKQPSFVNQSELQMKLVT